MRRSGLFLDEPETRRWTRGTYWGSVFVTSRDPKISLALPVFNGEKYLGAALESIVNQTFTDFELVISDNASTDRTPEIIESYAKRDDRIRVIRQTKTVGAATNFNLLVAETKADIFKWCAHDDLLEPEYLEETYRALQDSPDSVLCHTHTVIRDLDEGGDEVFVPNFTMPPDDCVTRLREMLLYGSRCYEVFGLIRRAALARTDLIGEHRGGDNVLLCRLALLGPVLIVPRPLFILGRHQTQSTALLGDSQAYHAWFDGRVRKVSFPDWVLVAKFWRSTTGLDLSAAERYGCYRELLMATYLYRARLRQNLRVAIETVLFGQSDPRRRRRFRDTP
jgi:glycosyltransferase involved in cell wall biosynthesis